MKTSAAIQTGITLLVAIFPFSITGSIAQAANSSADSCCKSCEKPASLKSDQATKIVPKSSVMQIAQKPASADVKKQTTSAASTSKQKSIPEQRDAGVTVQTNTKEIEVVGEVVDTWCYSSGVMGEGRGEKHKKCARLCVGGGVTAGILADDGTLYIAAKHRGYNGCAGLLLPHVATRVKVKGWLAERGGIKLLKINSVEPVKTPAKKSTRRP
jgi:hypothetical protein